MQQVSIMNGKTSPQINLQLIFRLFWKISPSPQIDKLLLKWKFSSLGPNPFMFVKHCQSRQALLPAFWDDDMDRRTAQICNKTNFLPSRVAESFPVYLKAKTAILNNSTPRPELLSNFGLDKEAVGVYTSKIYDIEPLWQSRHSQRLLCVHTSRLTCKKVQILC